MQEETWECIMQGITCFSLLHEDQPSSFRLLVYRGMLILWVERPSCGYLVGRRNLCATSYINFGGGMRKICPQTNSEFRGIGRKGSC
jgi:hypothetical protein